MKISSLVDRPDGSFSDASSLSLICPGLGPSPGPGPISSVSLCLDWCLGDCFEIRVDDASIPVGISVFCP